MKELSRQVELMDLESANIRMAEYRAHIPDMQLLQKQLLSAIEPARECAATGELPHEASPGKYRQR